MEENLIWYTVFKIWTCFSSVDHDIYIIAWYLAQRELLLVLQIFVLVGWCELKKAVIPNNKIVFRSVWNSATT